MLRPLRSLIDTLALLPFLAGALLLAANTGSGRDLIAWAITAASGGQVLLEGLSGTLPLSPRIEVLTLRDADGAWMQVQRIALDLDPWPLLRGGPLGVSVRAEALSLERVPAVGGGGGEAPGLPFPIQILRLELARLTLDGIAPGAPPLALEGEGVATSPEDLSATLTLTAPGRPDRYHLEMGFAADRYRLNGSAQESPGGLVATLLGPLRVPESLGGWRLEAQAEGPASALALEATLEAGPLKANAAAVLDLQAQVATRFHLSADTTASTLAPWGHPDIAWDGAAVQAELHGPWTGPQIQAQVALSGLAARDLEGQVQFDLTADLAGPPQLKLTGTLGLDRGPAPLPQLLGSAAGFILDLRQDGDAWQIANAELAGTQMGATIRGRVGPDALAFAWTLDLPDLAALAPGWTGWLRATGGMAGTPTAPDLVADLTSSVAPLGADAGQLQGRLRASPAIPSGSLALTGDWAKQPVTVNLSARRDPDGVLYLDVGDSRLGGLAAAGALRLPVGAAWPLGELHVEAQRLADLAPLLARWTGPGLAGQLKADLALDAEQAHLVAQGGGLALSAGMGIGSMALDARIKDPLGSPRTDATLHLRQVTAGTIGSDMTVTAVGPLAALDLVAAVTGTSPHGPLKLDLAGRLDGPARRLALSRLEARTLGETFRLTAPAVLDLSAGLAVDRLRLGLGQGTIDVTGRLTPQLDLDATIARLPLAPFGALAPDLPLAGTLNAQLRLKGPLDGPLGTIAVQGEGLRLTEGHGRALPAGRASLKADLGPNRAEVDVRAQLGPKSDLRLRGAIAGRFPGATGVLDLRANGRLDLALLDPLVGSGGRQIAGQAVLATTIAGSLAEPRLDGTLDLADASLRDRGLGLALTEIGGTLRLAGDRVLVDLRSRAGPGTITLEGTVEALAPGQPVDLRLTAQGARPIERDDLKIIADADLSLRGRLAETATLAGPVRFKRIDVHLPERLPATVATLEVRERGGNRARQPPEPPRTPPDLDLDLTLVAPQAVYIRGRGVDAELGGEVRVTGTLADPAIVGGFDLRRGQYDLVGQTLNFTRGRLGFDGATGIDPTLDLEARVTAAGSTAILAVLGTATAPRIELRGEPEIPQDEVLSRLLFGVTKGRLSSLQAARLGMAAASLAGVGGGSLGFLDRVRSGLGLDRLSVGGGEGTLEGGRQLDDRIYLGVRQGTRAGEPQAVLRIGLTPRVRLEADVGPTGGTRAGGAYEIEY